MSLTKRGRKAVRAILRGERVDFSGWPTVEVLAVLDAAVSELKAIRDRCQRQLAEMQARVDESKAMVLKIEESIERLLEVRAGLVVSRDS